MKIKVDNILIFKTIALVYFFSNIINYYILRSTYFVEFFSIFLIFYGFFIQKNTVNKDILISFFLSITVLAVCLINIIRVGGEFDDTAKETYRFFSVSFVFLSFFTVKIPYRELFKFILLLCKLYVFYNIYEIVYLNLISPGNIEGLVFGTGILDFYKNDVKSAYFLPQGEFLIPFIRPFGMWFQPQKSAFIFPIAIIVLYIYNKYFEKVKNKYVWDIIFILSALITGSKTALLAIIILYVIINISPPKRKISFKQFIVYGFVIVLIVGIISYIILLSNFSDSVTSASAFTRDLTALLRTNFFNLVFGLGFLDDRKMTLLGFAGETFIIRIIAQVGIVNFLLCFLLSLRVFFNKPDKIICMVMILGFYMILHYAVINIYLFTFVICLIIHYQKYAMKYE
jgi:hypothetical protein